MKFYIDAALSATVPYKNGPGLRTASTITIGSAEGGGNPFTGFLDRVGFANRALPPEQFDFPAVPLLGIRRNGSLLALSWRTGNVNYALQMNDHLQTAGWVNLPVQAQGDESTAVVGPTNFARYYRLQRP